MKRNRPCSESTTFRDTLNRLEGRHAAALMHRARLANRLAKRAEASRGRRNAYAAKALALEALALRFPEAVTVRTDPLTPSYVIVAVPAAHFGLHAPAERIRAISIR